MKKENVPMELTEDEDIELAILDELENDSNDEKINVSLLDPNELVKLKREFEIHDETISDEFESVSISYFNIGYELISMSKMDLTLFGYKDIYDYGNARFKLKTTSIKNMMNVVKKCCIEDPNVGLKVKSEYVDFSYSQLVELLSVEDKDLINFDSSMTIKQIRENKVLIKMNEYYFKDVDSELKNIRHFVDVTFNKPAHILGIVLEPTSKEQHFLEMCDLLGDSNIEIVKNGVSERADVYEYEYELKISYSNYKKYPFTIRFELKYDSKNDHRFLNVKSFYSYWFNAPVYKGCNYPIDTYNNFKEIYKFFSDYLDTLAEIKQQKENEKLEKEKTTVEQEKRKKLEAKFNEIVNKKLMRYGDNKKLLNSCSSIKNLLKEGLKKITISDDDEVFVLGGYNYPALILKLTDTYYFNFNSMSIEKRDENFKLVYNPFDYKTKEYYQMIFDFIRNRDKEKSNPEEGDNNV